MTGRRTLTAGLKTPAAPVDPSKEKEFVYGQKADSQPELSSRGTDLTPVVAQPPARIPLSTRMRGDFAEALKTASLERQLKKVQPNTLTDILEEAVEP